MGCLPHFVSKKPLGFLNTFPRLTFLVLIHIACSCGFEGFIEVDLLGNFRRMVHSLVAELFRAVNEEWERTTVKLQDKSMHLLPGFLPSRSLSLYFQLHNH
jgi:hypothetical protein